MPARRGEAWNDEDYRTLRAMARAGRTLREISRALERTPEPVLLKARRLRLEIKRD